MREKVFHLTEQEIPYATHVEVRQFDESIDPLLLGTPRPPRKNGADPQASDHDDGDQQRSCREGHGDQAHR